MLVLTPATRFITSEELVSASAEGDGEKVALFLKLLANPNHQVEDGSTALHFAAANGHVNVVRKLILAGADKSIKDVDGQTAMDIAVTTCRSILEQQPR